MGDSVPEHTGPISLTDTHPRTEHLQNPTAHHWSKPQRWKSLFLRDAQAAGRCNGWASNSTPFFQMVKLIAAIFRAKVRRAIVGRIPACVAAFPTTGFPYGGMYEKASSAAGRLP